MKHLGLFEGIGGFSLAARWMGWETVAWCEWNEFGQRVLRHHFPEAIGHGDITQTDFTPYANKIDILTGGFPCQPYSQAGKRLGKDDERHLFPEMLRAIREIKPTYIVGENVYGLTNWNGGVVFEEVCADLEAEGYEVQPVLLPASGIGAPHHRMRVWFVAYAKNFGSTVCKLGKSQTQQQIQTGRDIDGSESLGLTPNTECSGLEFRNEAGNIRSKEGKARRERSEFTNDSSSDGDDQWLTPDTDSDGQHQCDCEYEVNTSQGGEYAFDDVEQTFYNSQCIGRVEKWNDDGFAQEAQQKECGKQQFSGTNSTYGWWWNFPTQSPICSGDDGLPRELDGITFPKWRKESIKAYGNAIVPQVALQIFKAIEAMSFQQD